MLEIGPNLMKAIIETGGNIAGVSVIAVIAILMYKLMTKGLDE